MTDAFDLFGSYGVDHGGGDRPERAPREKPKNFALEKLLEIKKERERGRKAYLAMDRAWVDNILDCAEGPRVRALLAWAETLGPEGADELVDTVAGESWLLKANPDVRFVTLRRLDFIIIALRVKEGLPPIDDIDALNCMFRTPEEIRALEFEMNAFFKLKNLLQVH